jgi:spectinomycin phosphotransferase
VHELPPDLTGAELTVALARHWRLTTDEPQYLPAGFGGWHWSVTDAGGGQWFVTASRVDDEAAFTDLAATMAAACALAAARLDFVVAPWPSASGQAACRIKPGWALTVFPFEAGMPGHFGDQTTAASRAEVTGMLAALHSQDFASGSVPVRPLQPASRDVLEQALQDCDRPWQGGPYSEAARTLVSEHAADLGRAIAAFDVLCSLVVTDARPLVLTHGEPHPGNLLRRDGRYLLIDWDTAGLAPPERDLWWIASDAGTEAARYAELTGREVSRAALELYRLRWDLDDAGLVIADLRAPHADDGDTRTAWGGLRGAVTRLSAAAWHMAGF